MNVILFKKSSKEGGDGKDFVKIGGNDGIVDLFG